MRAELRKKHPRFILKEGQRVSDNCEWCCGDDEKTILAIHYIENKIVLLCSRCGNCYLRDVEVEDE
jgi:hypothetical protein